MTWERPFEQILDEILTDFRNTNPGVDTSRGSLAYMKAAGTASALWGLYRYMQWIQRQIHADTADKEALEHHAWIRGLSRVAGEDDAEYLARYLNFIRNPPAGGNKNDYEMWAKSIDGVARAFAIPLAQGGESVDVIVLADAGATGSEIPDPDLLAEVAAYIETVRPVGARLVRVLAPEVVRQDVTMAGVGSAIAAETAADIESYMLTLDPGVPLYIPQLAAIAVANGASNPTLTLPVESILPTRWQMIRPGVIDVS